MKVTLNVDITGTRNGEDWPPRGSVVDLPDHEAEAMIAGGLAEAVDVKAKPAPETAAAPAAPENAAAPKPRTRKASGLTTKNTP